MYYFNYAVLKLKYTLQLLVFITDKIYTAHHSSYHYPSHPHNIYILIIRTIISLFPIFLITTTIFPSSTPPFKRKHHNHPSIITPLPLHHHHQHSITTIITHITHHLITIIIITLSLPSLPPRHFPIPIYINTFLLLHHSKHV